MLKTGRFIKSRYVLYAFVIVNCRSVATRHYNEHALAYKIIFNQRIPENAVVKNSFLVTYRPAIGSVSSADYELEVVADRRWLNYAVSELGLGEPVADCRKDVFPGLVIERRKEHASKWYAPKELDHYICYYSAHTSIPYVQLLVDKETLKGSRLRIYLSKH